MVYSVYVACQVKFGWGSYHCPCDHQHPGIGPAYGGVQLTVYLVHMRRTTFDQLLCDNELWEKDNSGNGYGNVLECPQDMCRIHAGQTRKVSKSDYFAIS